MLDALATEEHFAEHLRPTWDALPDSIRGEWHDTAPPTQGPLTLVASYGDLKKARRTGRRVIYSEHGAGQSYVGSRSGSYIGSPDRAGAVGVLVPGRDAADRHCAVHPTIPAFPVGCPKLDDWHRCSSRGTSPESDAVIALSWHWECRVVPEARSAFRHYHSVLHSLAREFRGRVIGHGHPRIIHQLARHYRRAGIEVVEDLNEVMGRADILAVDNSSVLYEFASLGRPTVALNAPWYRRDIAHGLRFWSDIPGEQCDHPDDLAATIRRALHDSSHAQRQRRDVIERVYGPCDGRAAERAVAAIVALHDRWEVTDATIAQSAS
ncbi:MAG: CDP-glycerol glycerophosphotransferase family protein [Solirubrobacteraceae bacterium]|nr:CDP-glycerol glycerophosphotransferase family protein [Solirubrobacteraceae bacterium]